MDSERIDWFSECGVDRKIDTGLLGRVKASLLRRKRNKARRSNDMDPTNLILRHNRVFGIDSSDPSAAIRKDLRTIPPESSVDPGPLEFNIHEPREAERPFDSYQTEEQQVTVPENTVSVTDGGIAIPTGEVGTCGVANFEPNIHPETERIPAESDDFFKEIGQKYGGQTETIAETVEVIEVPVCDVPEISAEVAEFEDARTEDIIQYVEGEIVRETRQTAIDDPAFDVAGAPASAEPVLVRQERLDVEFEPPAYKGDLATDLAAANAAAEAVAEAVTSQSVLMEETEAVPETSEVPASETAEVPALAAPSSADALALAPTEVPSMLAAPAETYEIAEPAPASLFAEARERNASNAEAEMYSAAVADAFESQIAEVEASGASADVCSVQIAQIMGGMLIASRIAAGAVAEPVEEAVVEEVTAEPVQERDISGLYEAARARNSSNAEAGRYGPSAADAFESQIAEVEASGASADACTVQLAQIMGGMIIASQTAANAVPAPVEETIEEAPAEAVVEEIVEPVQERDISGLYEAARARNSSFAEAGRYGPAEASVFESQISEVEASGASADACSVQLAQIMGGMIIATQTAANAVPAPVEEPVEEVIAPAVEEPVQMDDGSVLEAISSMGMPAFAAAEETEDVQGILDAISSMEMPAFAVPAEPSEDVKAMLEAMASMGMPRFEMPAEPVEVQAPAEPAPVVEETVTEDVPAEDKSGVSFRFGQSSYRGAVRGTVVRFVFGSVSN